MSSIDKAIGDYSTPRMTFSEMVANTPILREYDDYYRMAGKAAPSLLEVMDGIAGGEGIDFDPPKLDIQIQAASLD